MLHANQFVIASVDEMSHKNYIGLISAKQQLLLLPVEGRMLWKYNKRTELLNQMWEINKKFPITVYLIGYNVDIDVLHS